MPKTEIADVAELRGLAGREIAVGDWFEITQERVDQFADATNDHQWIHVDTERAARESPYAATIAHGFLTLSLIPFLTSRSFEIRQRFRMRLNYGLNKVRFMNPVKVGSRIRDRVTLLDVADVPGGYQVRLQVSIEIEGQEKPACVAETLGRMYV
jgi:acyl dehydratase